MSHQSKPPARNRGTLRHDRPRDGLHAAGGHEYVPDFLVQLDSDVTLILETKGGRDELADVKAQAAERWVAAVNANGQYGRWRYSICRDMNLMPTLLDEVGAAGPARARP